MVMKMWEPNASENVPEELTSIYTLKEKAPASVILQGECRFTTRQSLFLTLTLNALLRRLSKTSFLLCRSQRFRGCVLLLTVVPRTDPLAQSKALCKTQLSPMGTAVTSGWDQPRTLSGTEFPTWSFLMSGQTH